MEKYMVLGDKVRKDSEYMPFEGVLKKILPSSWFWNKTLPTNELKDMMIQDAASGKGIHLDNCQHFHDHACELQMYSKGLRVMIRTSKIYALAHIIPFLLFKRGKDKWTLKSLKKLIIGIARSLIFIGIFGVFGRGYWCNALKWDICTPAWCRLFGAISASGILVESPSRWGEFAMTVVPRLLESYQIYLKKQGLWINVPLGRNMMFAFAMAATSSIFFTDSECIKRSVRWAVSLILGSSDFHEVDSAKHSQLKTLEKPINEQHAHHE